MKLRTKRGTCYRYIMTYISVFLTACQKLRYARQMWKMPKVRASQESSVPIALEGRHFVFLGYWKTTKSFVRWIKMDTLLYRSTCYRRVHLLPQLILHNWPWSLLIKDCNFVQWGLLVQRATCTPQHGFHNFKHVIKRVFLRDFNFVFPCIAV